MLWVCEKLLILETYAGKFRGEMAQCLRVALKYFRQRERKENDETRVTNVSNYLLWVRWSIGLIVFSLCMCVCVYMFERFS